jgi:hypothetical protein
LQVCPELSMGRYHGVEDQYTFTTALEEKARNILAAALVYSKIYHWVNETNPELLSNLKTALSSTPQFNDWRIDEMDRKPANWFPPDTDFPADMSTIETTVTEY